MQIFYLMSNTFFSPQSSLIFMPSLPFCYVSGSLLNWSTSKKAALAFSKQQYCETPIVMCSVCVCVCACACITFKMHNFTQISGEKQSMDVALFS